MSAYRDYIIDFPSRCLNILNNYEPDARNNDLEVTLMLMAATSAFVIPMERLDKKHLSQDFIKLREHISKYHKELGKHWDKSSLSKDMNGWRYGLTKNFGNGPDGCHTFDDVNERTVSEILSIIRNALAHGNLYTKGNPIKYLVFYSEKRGELLSNCEYEILGYRHLHVPVSNLRQFLLNWFDLLDSMNLSNREALIELTKNKVEYELMS